MTLKGTRRASVRNGCAYGRLQMDDFHGPLCVAMATHFGNSRIPGAGKQGASVLRKVQSPLSRSISVTDEQNFQHSSMNIHEVSCFLLPA